MTGRGSLQETAKFAQRLNDSQYTAGIIVPGNHDWIFQQMPEVARKLFDPRFAVLIDQGCEWGGLSFWGSPWTPPFLNWAFMKTEEELAEVYAGMPMQLDFLITHGPRRGILDNELGSTALRDAVGTRCIRHHAFGHIHEEGGKAETSLFDGHVSYNVAACNLKYELVNQPRIIEVD